MKIVSAFDSFKGSLSSKEISAVVTKSIAEIECDIQVDSLVMADGGEGTLNALVEGGEGQIYSDLFTNLQGEKELSSLGFVDDLCVIESAQTVGLTMSDKQNISLKTSKGIGEQILCAIKQGYRKFAVGLGGSGTNDCGIGMLKELGFQFLDAEDQQLHGGIRNFVHLDHICIENVAPEVWNCKFTILSDVVNPLVGENGSTYVYGPQKGIGFEELTLFDSAFRRISEVAAVYYGKDCSSLPGAGAAGGLGYAFLQFLHAETISGCDYVLKFIGAENLIKKADFIFTGEGRTDAQTANGKVPVGVAKIAMKYGKPVILVSGALSKDAYKLHDKGISFMTSVLDYPAELAHVMRKDVAAELLSNRIKELVHLLNLF